MPLSKTSARKTKAQLTEEIADLRRQLAARPARLSPAAGAARPWLAAYVDAGEQAHAASATQWLADATGTLLSARDYPSVLAAVSHEAVPAIADWCVVHVRSSDGQPAHWSVSHAVPEKVDLAQTLHEHYASALEDAWGRPDVLGTGRAVLVPRVDAEAFERGGARPELAALVDELQPGSFIVAPLAVDKQIFGSIALAAASGVTFGPPDLEIATEYARRAGLAIDRARLFESSQRELARLVEANRSKDDLLATVSHQLRTPLNAILGWTRMLRADEVDPARRGSALETVERNARALAQLVEDLVDVSRIASRKLRLNVRGVELINVVEAAIEAVRPEADARGIRLLAVLDPDAGPIVGDPDRLQQVVWNFLNNALRFTPRSGRVQVHLRRNGSHVEIAVADTGRGVRIEDLANVFDGLRRADGVPGGALGDLGLGLTVARHLVELHGGSVQALSEGEGKGATFVARLPVSPTYADGGSAPLIHPTAADRGIEFECPPEIQGLRVLVVDDEADARELLMAVLHRCGATVSAAGSASDAFDAVRRGRPDVLISDIGMPAEDGYSLIRRIRALPADQGGRTPALALTAYARMTDRTRALLAGFQMHVAKPIDPAELVVVVANLAGRIAAA